MYTIHVDGQLLFSTANQDDEHIILSPKLSLDINGAGSFTFVIPPGNKLHGSIQKIKSIVTVEWDGKTIFRGRVLDDERDFYNQKNVYCEGDKTFLLDSLYKPYTYKGKIRAFFEKLITSHNEQVDDEKKFTIGNITAVSEDATMEAKDESYQDTSSVIEDRLISAYGGYIQTRTEGDVHYIDWLSKEKDADEQEIEFGVNLLDLKERIDAADVFTILIPLGESKIDDDGNYEDPVNIKSVNGGLDYIQDDAAVALYGKIWRTYTWPYEDSPKRLLEKGKEYLKTGAAVQTLNLTAVDMHFTDSSKKEIWIGDHPRIFSNPHGLDITPICARMNIDLLNPEKTTYTFGEPPRTLTDNFIQTEEEVHTVTGGGGGRGVQQEVGEVLRWAEVRIDEENARITELAWDYDELSGKYTNITRRVDAVEGVIETEIKETIKDIDGRVTESESLISQHSDQIEMRVSKDGVISAINQSPESITIKAEKINLSGYVTADKLATEIANLKSAFAENMTVKNFACTSFHYGGQKVAWKNHSYITGGKITITTLESTSVRDSNGNTIGYVNIPSVMRFDPTYGDRVYYLGYE